MSGKDMNIVLEGKKKGIRMLNKMKPPIFLYF